MSPIRRATNPLMATLGGVVGPVAAYVPLPRWRVEGSRVRGSEGPRVREGRSLVKLLVAIIHLLKLVAT